MHNTSLRVATQNIHKGMSLFNRRVVIHAVRDDLRAFDADVLFLQEVAGRHDRHARHSNWPSEPQQAFLTENTWSHAYGCNAVHRAGEHGNAIVSRYPIVRWENEDISTHRFESRGLLHAEIAVPDWTHTLHAVCVHLALTSRGRARQLEWLRQRIERSVPADAPLIVAGDFNDWHWRHRATHEFAHPLNMHEVFETNAGAPARSFPALLPLLRLDRIYVRGFSVGSARVCKTRGWRHGSDHRALVSDLQVLV